MENFVIEPDIQEKISVEELSALVFKILKRNLSTRDRITSYYKGSLKSIMAFELLRGPGNREIKRHSTFEKKFAQAIQLLRDKGLIMQDHTQPHAQEFVELTEKGEKMEPDKFFPLIENSDEVITKLESSLGQLDQVAKIYLQESLDTFKSDFIISSAFCLGATSERYILILADSVKTVLNNQDVSKAYSSCKSVKHYANLINDNISKLKKKYPGNDDLFRDLDTKMNTLAGYYRMTRNEAGHPDFVPQIEHSELELALKTFPKYLDTIIRVLKLLGF